MFMHIHIMYVCVYQCMHGMHVALKHHPMSEISPNMLDMFND